MDVSSADHNDLPIVSITTDPDGLFNEKRAFTVLGTYTKNMTKKIPTTLGTALSLQTIISVAESGKRNVMWSISTVRATALFLRIAA